jgi:transcription termination/antitermination protein NusG
LLSVTNSTLKDLKMNVCEAPHNDVHHEPYPAKESFLAGGPDWFAVSVRSRHEFVALDELCRKRITAFLPSVHRMSQWKDRKKLVEFPLFPGYLFVQEPASPEAFQEVLKTRGVVGFISLEHAAPTPIAPEEIASLRLLVESGKELNVFPDLQEGVRVRIKNGPLKNAEGIVTRKNNEYLFQINIELLGRSVAVQISAREIEAA